MGTAPPPPPPMFAGDSVTLNLTSLWAPSPNGVVPPDGHIPGDGCASAFTQDLVFVNVSAVGGAVLASAHTSEAGDQGELWNVTMVVQDIPEVLSLSGTRCCM